MERQTLVLIRGLPGSGKSTLAGVLQYSLLYEAVDHFEADMYHIDKETGEYNFDPGNVQKAHLWCQTSTDHALSLGHSVIVSNTFTRNWEMEPYLLMASDHGVPVQVIECHGRFDNIHNVPAHVIENMVERWEPYHP